MRLYARLPISIWLQRYASEDVRTLLLYIACGPHSNGIGCYRLPMLYVVEDLKWTMERAQVALELSTAVSDGKPLSSPSQGLISYDNNTSFVLWHRAFEASPIESPNGAKALIPFIDAVPKDSPVFDRLLSMLEPFASKFPKGYWEGLRSPTLSPCLAEQASSSSSKEEFILKPSELEAARGKSVDKSQLNLSEPTVAAVVVAKMLGRKRLTADDQIILHRWCREFDIEHVVLPWLEKRLVNYKDLHNLAHPLKYFSAGLTEHVEKSRIKK
jgi:hypothetical protein